MNKLITKEECKELLTHKGEGMTSAVGEYTPDALWDALYTIESLRSELAALKAGGVSELRQILSDPIEIEAFPGINDRVYIYRASKIDMLREALASQAAPVNPTDPIETCDLIEKMEAARLAAPATQEDAK